MSFNGFVINCGQVPMILKARVGVGIIGKEGTLAKMSSDYAIPRFYMLKCLLAVHGRYAFKRSAAFIQYSFYKNNVVAFVQSIFFFYNLFSGQALFDTYVITFQNYLFTLLNPFVFGLFEKDIDEEYLEDAEYGPLLYKNLKKEHIFNWYTFIKWIGGSLIHGIIIFFFCMYGTGWTMLTNGQGDGLWGMCSLTYTCIFLVITLKCYIEMEHFTIMHHLSMILSFIFFIIFVVVYSSIPSNMTQVWFSMMQSVRFWFIVLLCVVTCLAIDVAFTAWKNMVNPDYYARLKMQGTRPKKKKQKHHNEISNK